VKCVPPPGSFIQTLVTDAQFRHDDTGTVPPGAIAASALHRQWIGLSITGDNVEIDVLPPPPHPAAPLFLESVDIELGFFTPQEATEQYSVDDIAKLFVKAFSGIIMGVDLNVAFEFRGMPLKGKIKSALVLELADEQRRGSRGESTGGGVRRGSGILMEKTDVNFMKAPNSNIKLKSSAKK